jgi:hypothetical protein
MTATDTAGRAEPGCGELGGGLLDGYAGGGAGAAVAWSVEAHLPACAACRAALTARLDAGRLERNRAILLTRLALADAGPDGGPLRRLLRRGRVPDHVITLLAATPSLRRSWLAGIGLALAAAIGVAHLAGPGLPAAGPVVIGGAAGPWARLMPFLVLAPLLPLAAVAAAFSVRLDPAHDLAVAAPVSAVWLLCVRAAAVISVTLVPTALAALALPGPWWLPAVLLLPALAVCTAALAAATAVGPVAGAIGAGAAWVAAVTAIAIAGHDPSLAFGPAGQGAAVAVVIGGVLLLAARRQRIELGWARGADR